MFSIRTYFRWLCAIGDQIGVSWHQVLRALIHEYMLEFDSDYVVWLVKYHCGLSLDKPDDNE